MPEGHIFDRVIVADWSGRASPSPARLSKDAIWIGTADAAGTTATYHRTRAAAEAALSHLMAGDGTQLIGFDFPMGHPAGTARRLTGTDDPRVLHALLADLIRDAPDNANNRFQVAAELNRRLAGAPPPHPFPEGGEGGAGSADRTPVQDRRLPSPSWGGAGEGGHPPQANGPFWGRPMGQHISDLSPFKPAIFPLPEKRAVELLAKGAKSVWQLMGAGSVGSQTLLGIPSVHRLAARSGAAVWPFDPPGRLTIAEVYPSLLARAVRASGDKIPDRAQVTLLARALFKLARAGRLAPLFDVPDIAREEGWILGQGHAPLLEAALAW